MNVSQFTIAIRTNSRFKYDEHNQPVYDVIWQMAVKNMVKSKNWFLRDDSMLCSIGKSRE